MTDYGSCPNGCTVPALNQDGSVKEVGPNPMRKRGHAVFCNKCRHSTNRGKMILRQLRLKEAR